MVSGLSLRCDAEEFSKIAFVRHAAPQVSAGALLLDAGVGSGDHRKFFPHVRYESCDLFPPPDNQPTYVCDVAQIPVRDGHFDAVLCIQVLDDVPDPQAVVHELFRVLRPGGALFLTAPMSGRLHNEPYHYFQFTRYGLELLFRTAGFRVESVAARGGFFWVASYLSRKLPRYLYRQHRMVTKPGARRAERLVALLANAPMWLLYLAARPVLEVALPLACFYLDRLDRERAFTLGWGCHVVRPEDSPRGS